MQVSERTKLEMAAKAAGMSDFLRMEYLERCLQTSRDPTILKFCYFELAKLYEARVMYADAIKYLNKLQALVSFGTDKLKLYEKEIELLMKSGNYERVGEVYRSALKVASSEVESMNLRRKIVKLYQLEAQKFESAHKHLALLKVYERLIPLLTDNDRNETKKKLFVVYQKLGKVKESIALENSMR